GLVSRRASLLAHPRVHRKARLDRFDAAVALARVIVAGIDDDHPVRRIGEQTGREVRNILLRNGNHDQIDAANGFWDRDSGRAGFGGQFGERFRTSRVCYKNLVSQRGKATGQRAANLACADDPNLHVFILRGGSRKPMSASRRSGLTPLCDLCLNFYRERPHFYRERPAQSPHEFEARSRRWSGDGAGNTAPHEFCSTSFASERVPTSERCTWGASNRNQNFHLRTGLTRRRLWSLLTQTVTMAEPHPTRMTSHKRLAIAGCGARIRT